MLGPSRQVGAKQHVASKTVVYDTSGATAIITPSHHEALLTSYGGGNYRLPGEQWRQMLNPSLPSGSGIRHRCECLCSPRWRLVH
jgi:hypothetical protein